MLVITWTVLAPEIVTTAQAAAGRANRVTVSYVPPKNAAHQPIYEQLKEVSFLEKLQQFLAPFRLPRALLVKVEGCDGDANAFYENDVITVCYEYIEPENHARGNDGGWRRADRRPLGPPVRHQPA
jgi:Putative metallopeptidase